jgi:hypothetical protein
VTILPLVERIETVQVYFTYEGEGLKAKETSWVKSLHGVLHGGLWIGFVVYQNLRHVHLQEVGLTQIPGDRDFV